MCAETDEKDPCCLKKGDTCKYLTKSMKDLENIKYLSGPQQQAKPLKGQIRELDNRWIEDFLDVEGENNTLKIDDSQTDGTGKEMLKHDNENNMKSIVLCTEKACVKQDSINKEDISEHKESERNSRAEESDEEETYVKEVVGEQNEDAALDVDPGPKGERSLKYKPFEKEDAPVETGFSEVEEQDMMDVQVVEVKTEILLEKQEDEQNEKQVSVDSHSISHADQYIDSFEYLSNLSICGISELDFENELSSQKFKAVIRCYQPNICQSMIFNDAETINSLRDISENVLGRSVQKFCQKRPFKVDDFSLDNRFRNLFLMDNVCSISKEHTILQRHHHFWNDENNKELLQKASETEHDGHCSTESLIEDEKEEEVSTDIGMEGAEVLAFEENENASEPSNNNACVDQKQAACNVMSKPQISIMEGMEKKRKEEVGSCSCSGLAERNWEKEAIEECHFQSASKMRRRWNGRKNEKQNKRFLQGGNHSHWKPRDPSEDHDFSSSRTSHAHQKRAGGRRSKRKQRWFRGRKHDFRRWFLGNKFMRLAGYTAPCRCRSGGQGNKGFRAENQDSGDASDDESDNEENDGMQRNNNGHGDRDGDDSSNYNREQDDGKKQGGKEKDLLNEFQVSGGPKRERGPHNGLIPVVTGSKKGEAVQEPSLPRPHLDDEHIAHRLAKEEEWYAKQDRNRRKSPVFLISQDEFIQSKPSASAIAEEGLVLQHAAISQNEICDVIGTATTFRLNIGSQEWKKFNTCLRNVMHDISLVSQAHDFDCMLCLVLGGLLMHLADTKHDGGAKSCEQCSQIVCLIIKHAEVCMHDERKKERDSQADLCYKICRFANWSKAKVVENLESLQVKVKKYCTKALGNPDNNEFAACEQGNNLVCSETEGVLAEGVGNNDSLPSTGRSSTSSLSLKGNVVTTPSSNLSDTPSVQAETTPKTSSGKDVQVISSSLVPGSISRSAAVMPNSVAPHSAGNAGAGNSHSSLMRKPSWRRTPAIPAIPQPITEEAETGSGSQDDIETLIYKRYGNSSKGADPYDTQPTYGERNRVESMRVEVFHDQEQFISLWNRPTGVKGIGEVVFAHNSQLHVVARFWERKRDHCERTGSCPYQHREEGVILAEMKEYFTILKTRYQKHQQWERVTHLGSGMSGKCHLAIDLKTGFKFCCKKIHLLRYEQQEVSLWAEMHNPFIVRLYGAIRHGVRIYIFSEFVDGGSLAACINEQKLLGRRLSHWTAINYFQQILKVLAYLQRKNMLHEDIKADNILLRRNTTFIAVTDFGTSRHLRDPVELKNKSPVGSPTHWSPEKASMEGHGFPSDVWAAVCVLLHMLSGEHPWMKRYMNASILNFIIYSKPAPLEDVPANVQAEVKDLMAKGFIKDPQSRPTASELLRHPAFEMLAEGTPESYFSTLVSSNPELASARKAPTHEEERPVPEFENNLTSRAETSSPENLVLHSRTINSSGPYQESNCRVESQQTNVNPVEFLHEENDEGEEENGKNNTSKDSDQIVGETPDLNGDQRDVREDRAQESETSIQEAVDQNVRSEDLIQSNTALEQSMLAQGNENNTDCTHPDVKGKLLKSKSEVEDLLNPDIEKFLPITVLLPPHGDSENTHSIRSFFEDTYDGSENFQKGKVQHSELQKFEPSPKSVGQVPLLSVFDESFHSSTHSQQHGLSMTITHQSVSLTEVKEIASTNEQKPSGEESEGQTTRYPQTFHSSYSSDEYSSKDLFASGPDAEDDNVRVVLDGSPSSGDVVRSPKYDENTPLDSSYGSGGSSNMHSMDQNSAGSSGLSNFQQRKPADLKIEMNVPSSTERRSNFVDESKKSQIWIQQPSSQGSHSGPIQTPSTGRLTSSSRKSSGNTGSGYSPFFNPSRGSSVIEEQEKQLEEMQAGVIETMSQSGSDNGKFADMLDFQPDNYLDEFPKEDEDSDLKSTLTTLQGEIDETALGGHKLEFYNDRGERLFEMRIRDWPIYWKCVIGDVCPKIKTYSYVHFVLKDITGGQLDFGDTLTSLKIKIISLTKPSQYHCWCSQCHGY